MVWSSILIPFCLSSFFITVSRCVYSLLFYLRGLVRLLISSRFLFCFVCEVKLTRFSFRLVWSFTCILSCLWNLLLHPLTAIVLLVLISVFFFWFVYFPFGALASANQHNLFVLLTLCVCRTTCLSDIGIGNWNIAAPVFFLLIPSTPILVCCWLLVCLSFICTVYIYFDF